MKNFTASIRSFTAMVAALGLLTVGLAACGGGSGGQDVSRQMDMVTVNWIEGMALTYAQEALLEDSLNMDVSVREVSGGGIAFKSVASGDQDYFNEAWLPTTHQAPWDSTKSRAQKLGYTYKGTSVGVVVPAYMEADTFPDFSKYRQELDGTLNGIESGAAINGQMRKTIELYNMGDGFSVTAASGPANWQALKTAIQNKQPIAVAGWKPHWKWSSYDLKYIDGAQTGHNVDIWGQPEDIFKIVDNQFVDEFPKKAVCLLKHMEVNDQQIGTLMNTFRNRGDMSKQEAAAQWIENHPEWVSQWMNKAEQCAASDSSVETLPDDALYSSDQSGQA